MGGMSSLSFDSTFASEPENRSANVQDFRSPHEVNAEPVRIGRFPAAVSSIRVVGDASPWALSAVRRLVDIAVALAALIAFAPLMLVAGALVRFGSRGPVFFRQKRMGRFGKEFTLYKFRSMTPAQGAGCCITVAGDARITPVGAFLRRYKLDELPQFWNVLKGDMGLVGPRPKLPHHEALHMACRPGITGVATLAFHKEEEFLSTIPEEELDAFYEVFVKPTKANMDQEYMRTATFSTDLSILWRTASSCLFGAKESPSGPAETIARSVSNWTRGRSAPSSVAQPASRLAETRIRSAGAAAELS